MTLREQIDKLEALATDLVALNKEMEAKKKEYRDLFKDAVGIDTAEPIDISKIVDALKKALS